MWILEDRRLLFATKANISTSEWVEVFQKLVEGEAYALSN